MFRWFRSRKKLLREIKLQEEYIEILRKELDHQLEITGEKTCLFYEAMLQTGAYLNKIKEITEAQNEQRIFRNFI